jgi:nitrogenase molybdenum-iron protein beta chain
MRLNLEEKKVSSFIDRPRYACSLGGALATLRAIPRAIPVIHASAGCGQNLYQAYNSGGAYLGGGYCGGNALPSSNVVERDIVFGGEERLREQIKTTLEVMDGDLYVVLSGCMVEMIGDDLDAVVSDFEEEEKPVLAVHTPSFRGNSYLGYDLLLSAIVKKYITRQKNKKAQKVNVLGIVPSLDVFWEGNLKEVKRLLNRLGLEVNTFFGESETLQDIKNAGDASLNIVLSGIFGVQTAEVFQELHDIPYITADLPIGAHATEDFLKKVAAKLNIADRVTDEVIKSEKKLFYNYIERLADIYNDIDLQRYAIVIGDSNYAPAITRFLSDELGWLPELTVVTDMLEDNQKEKIVSGLDGLKSGLKANVKFDTNTSSVKKYISEIWERNHNERYYDSMTPTFIIGSVYERDLAAQFNYPILTASFPVTNRIVLNTAYAGINGGLRLTEDILSILVAGR